MSISDFFNKKGSQRNLLKALVKSGGPPETRTPDQLIKRYKRSRKVLIILSIIVLFSALGQCAQAADPWSKQDIALEVAWQGINLIDYAQTRNMAKDGWRNFHELNPVLGRYPSDSKINAYFKESYEKVQARILCLVTVRSDFCSDFHALGRQLSPIFSLYFLGAVCLSLSGPAQIL